MDDAKGGVFDGYRWMSGFKSWAKRQGWSTKSIGSSLTVRTFLSAAVYDAEASPRLDPDAEPALGELGRGCVDPYYAKQGHSQRLRRRSVSYFQASSQQPQKLSN
ncbi:hypothetical protein FRB93_009565 [Tulasnella sp. JGI-2019a]|nr:hypothetical protein FRB93_009565 [Tulasnella sp. JGI-2019a]